MGIKGEKNTEKTNLAAQVLGAKLEAIGGVTTKKMFGGHGIFHEGKMFGIIDSKGRPFLKADATNRTNFEKEGAERHSRMPYFSIPQIVLNDPEELIQWARTSIKISK